VRHPEAQRRNSQGVLRLGIAHDVRVVATLAVDSDIMAKPDEGFFPALIISRETAHRRSGRTPQ